MFVNIACCIDADVLSELQLNAVLMHSSVPCLLVGQTIETKRVFRNDDCWLFWSSTELVNTKLELVTEV
jgi:hypothetical protein